MTNTAEDQYSQSITEVMETPIGKLANQMALQGMAEGRLLIHDTKGVPVAALVYIRGDVVQRLLHLDRFVETNPAPLLPISYLVH